MPMLEQPGARFPYDDDASKHYEGEVTDSEVETLLSELSTSQGLIGKGRVCVLFGNGSRPKSAYVRLKRYPGATVLWDGPLLPCWALPLTWVPGLLAAHAGLVRIDEARSLALSFRNLATAAMVDLYSFETSLLAEVEEHVRREKWIRKPDIRSIVAKDESSFWLSVDGDNSDSKTGIWGVLAHGAGCPADLREIARQASNEGRAG